MVSIVYHVTFVFVTLKTQIHANNSMLDTGIVVVYNMSSR
jgi:hypothetical protein